MKASTFLFFLIALTGVFSTSGHLDRYIVTFKSNVVRIDVQFHQVLLDRYEQNSVNWFQFKEDGKTIIGYSAPIPFEILNVIKSDSAVEYIEFDKPVYTLNFPNRNHLQQLFAPPLSSSSEWETQHNAPWGLARTVNKKWSGIETDYRYNSEDGKNVIVYVIDTGIYIEHKDFNGRAKWGKSFLENVEDTDENGHGTHCAGIIGGEKYGMCKHCSLIAVQVLNKFGVGSISTVLAGIEWVIGERQQTVGKIPFVINMSLGGEDKSKTLDRMINAAVDAGIHVVVAAGNEHKNACENSPASAEKVITVGASNLYDEMAYFSNYGPCNDIFAPGVDIESTWKSNDVKVLSGTSMSAPHVSGAVALLLSRSGFEEISPKQMKKFIKENATMDIIKNIPDNILTENRLLFVNTM